MFSRQNNETNTRNQNEQPSAPPSRFPMRAVLLFMLVGILIWIITGIYTNPATIDLPYSNFMQQVRDSNVHTIEMQGQQISGEFENAIEPPEDSSVIGGLPFAAPPEKLNRFATTIPEIGDDRLLPLLDEQNVEVVVQERQPSLLLNLLITLAPALLLLAFIFFILRSQIRNQQGIFSFGRSRAKAYTMDHPTVKFGDVAGAEEAKRELVEVVDFLKNPDRYKKLGAKIPRGALLVGPPGTGKTLLARAVAGEAGVPFFSTSASEFVELFVGVGASRVRDLFDQARRNAPAIIFVDELDAIGRQRGTGMGGGHDEREQTLNQILVEMDGFEHTTNVIVIAATNRPDVLDPALLRPGRFDRQITVGLPDVRGRQAVLDIHLRGKPLNHDVDPSRIARLTPGFAGADLANLVNEAALFAARQENRQISMRHFSEALDKIVLGTERPLLMDDHDRKVIAYHEAGHALVATLLPESDPINKVTIIPRGRGLGVTQYLPEGDRFNYSRGRLMTMLASLLGGRAAEQVAIGEITTGAENDLQRATQLARNMLGRWGMGEMGLLFADDGSEKPFLGREIAAQRSHSEATAAMLDEAVRSLLDERLNTAMRLLTDNRAALNRLTLALLEYETLDREGVEAAIRGDTVSPPTPPDVTPPGDPAGKTGDDQPALHPKPGIMPA